jgi:tyrosine-specific transport protein
VNTKLIGGTLLIIGTSIGGGMLALPVSNAPIGFAESSLFLIACWLIMTMGALLILEVNLRLPRGSNMISMASHTLGFPGKIIAWISYLCLLYTLLSAYISGGSDVLGGFLQLVSLNLPIWFTPLLFTAIFGIIVYKGIKTVDFVNRGLMFGKLGIYLLLVVIIAPHVSSAKLIGGNIKYASGGLMILIASFGFATIVPSLRDYFDDDIKSLRKVIVLGSLIPLCCYIIWDLVIMGTVNRDGTNGLIELVQSKHTTLGLITALQQSTGSHLITIFFSFFTSICMLTAFLGVSLGLFDFLSDGLKLEKSGKQGKLVFALTFLPPLAIVIINPGIYLKAMKYAGVLCVILLLMLPVLMAWRGRYQMQASNSQYMVQGGRMTLILTGLIALGLLIFASSQLYPL